MPLIEFVAAGQVFHQRCVKSVKGLEEHVAAKIRVKTYIIFARRSPDAHIRHLTVDTYTFHLPLTASTPLPQRRWVDRVTEYPDVSSRLLFR